MTSSNEESQKYRYGFDVTMHIDDIEAMILTRRPNMIDMAISICETYFEYFIYMPQKATEEDYVIIVKLQQILERYKDWMRVEDISSVLDTVSIVKKAIIKRAVV